MKTTLLLLGLLSISSLFGQNLIEENFNTMNIGNFSTAPSISSNSSTTAQNNWSVFSSMSSPNNSYYQVVSTATNENRLEITGSPTSSGSNYALKNINWSSRNSGFNIIYAECKFNTGSTSTSKNDFYFGIYDPARTRCMVGFIYTKDTRLLKGLAYDSTDATNNSNYSYSNIGSGNTQLILNDNTDYILKITYDANIGKSYWQVTTTDIPSTTLSNTAKQNNIILSNIGLLNLAGRPGTSNAASGTAYFDDIKVQARACRQFELQANADFSYPQSMLCTGTGNAAATLVDANSTGVFTSTPAGLSINEGSGSIDLNNSIAGSYTIKFVSNNFATCSDSATTTVTVTTSQTPSFNIVDLICTGSLAPTLATTSLNGIDGTWTPSTVDNNASATYTFTPNSGQCVLQVIKTINVVASPVAPEFTLPATICSGSVSPLLALTSSNGVTGTWSPATISNTNTGTYVFNPQTGACATSSTVDITIQSNVTPTFDIPTSICAGSVAPILSTSSLNSINGTWYPETVSNTTTNTYTFTPQNGVCATIATASIIVQNNVTPTFNLISSLCEGATAPILPSSSLNSVNGTWSPATVSNTTTGTYLFTPDNGICATTASSTITVEDCSSLEEINKNILTIYPNPTNSIVNIQNLIGFEKVYLTTTDGKVISENTANSLGHTTFQMNNLKSGIYFIKTNNTISKIILE